MGTTFKLGTADSLKNYRWHYWLQEKNNWYKLDSSGHNRGLVTSYNRGNGILGYFNNLDKQGPVIQVTSAGQRLLPDDFIPQRVPLDITIRDEVGVDFEVHVPMIKSQSTIDSARLVSQSMGFSGKMGVVQYTPDGEVKRDSLTIVARDISGNQVIETFVYQYGDGLSIKILGSYPNPFADTAVFVYQLTDYAESVQLKIYSRAGRLVKKMKDIPGSGYREMAWDGRSSKGVLVANGLYYLKIIAKSGGKEVSKIFKIFKKKHR